MRIRLPIRGGLFGSPLADGPDQTATSHSKLYDRMRPDR